jgi:hypothetical protein
VTVDGDIRGGHTYSVKCHGPKNQDTYIAKIQNPVANPIETDDKRKFLKVNCGNQTIDQIYSGSELTGGLNFQEGYGCVCTDSSNVETEILAATTADQAPRYFTYCTPSANGESRVKAYPTNPSVVTVREISGLTSVSTTHLTVKCSLYTPSTSGPFLGTINADYGTIDDNMYEDGYGCQCKDEFGTVTEEIVLSATAPESLTYRVKCENPTVSAGHSASLLGLSAAEPTPTGISGQTPTTDKIFIQGQCSSQAPTLTQIHLPAHVNQFTNGFGCKCRDGYTSVISEVLIPEADRDANKNKYWVKCLAEGSGSSEVFASGYTPVVTPSTPAIANKEVDPTANYLDITCSEVYPGADCEFFNTCHLSGTVSQNFLPDNSNSDYQTGTGCICRNQAGTTVEEVMIHNPAAPAANPNAYLVKCMTGGALSVVRKVDDTPAATPELCNTQHICKEESSEHDVVKYLDVDCKTPAGKSPALEAIITQIYHPTDTTKYVAGEGCTCKLLDYTVFDEVKVTDAAPGNSIYKLRCIHPNLPLTWVKPNTEYPAIGENNFVVEIDHKRVDPENQYLDVNCDDNTITANYEPAVSDYVEGYGCACTHATDGTSNVSADHSDFNALRYKVSCTGTSGNSGTVISYSQVSVTDQEADPSMKYFNVTCPTNVADSAIVEQTWSSTGSDYVEGYGCQCRNVSGTVQAEVIVDALTSARGSVKCLSSSLMTGEPKLHMPTSILVTAPEITPSTTGTYFKVTCPADEPSAYVKATLGTVERMATGSSLAYLPADGCTCHYKSGAVVTQVQINAAGQRNVMCMPGTGNGDWVTLRHDPKVLKETLVYPSVYQKFLEIDCASETITPSAAPANPESYSEGMGCKCMDASGYVSSQLSVGFSQSAVHGKFQVSCLSTNHA